jgi:hypothetical protein
VKVDAVFDQGAEDSFVIAVTGEAPADTVGLDDPQTQSFAVPDRFLCQAPHQDHREHVTIVRDPLDELIQGGLESGDFFKVIVPGHGLRLGLVLRAYPKKGSDPLIFGGSDPFFG